LKTRLASCVSEEEKLADEIPQVVKIEEDSLGQIMTIESHKYEIIEEFI